MGSAATSIVITAITATAITGGVDQIEHRMRKRERERVRLRYILL